MESDEESLKQIDGIGDVVASNIYNFFRTKSVYFMKSIKFMTSLTICQFADESICQFANLSICR